MKKTALLMTLVAISLVGCSSSKDTPVSKQDEKQFKGSPMPADARQKVNQAMADWQKKNANSPSGNAPAGGSAGNAAPGPGGSAN